MHYIQYNENTKIGYEYIPVGGSGNAILSTRYRTNMYIVEGTRQYDMGYWDEKLDEESIKLRFEEIMRVNQEAKYGQERGTVLRRELTPRRERGRTTKTRFDRGIAGGSILSE